jgi:hypothetical protein
MPQRFLVALVIAAMAVAACKGGSTSPTPSSTPYSPTPNPNITKAIVEVTINGTPRPRIPVEESTPRNKESPRPGKTIQTLITGKQGLTHFNHLKPSGVYCWVAILSPSQKSSECAGWAVWQTGNVVLGT